MWTTTNSWALCSVADGATSNLAINENGQFIVANSTSSATYTSSDYGVTFTKTMDYGSQGYNKGYVSCDPTGRYFAVITTNGFYTSSNYGSTWTNINTSPNITYLQTSFNGNNLFGTDGTDIWKYSFNNSNWTNMTNGNGPNLNYLNGNSEYLVGTDTQGNLRVTTTSSFNLQTISIPGVTGVNLAAISNDGTIIYAMFHGTNSNPNLFISTNSGGTWSNLNVPGYVYCINCSYNGENVAITTATPDSMGIYYSNDYGATFNSAYANGSDDNWVYGIFSGDGTILIGNDLNTGIYRLRQINVPPPICFLEGSKILCSIDGQETYVPIETIRKGTLVKTRLNGYIPVDMIGHSKIYNPGHSLHSKNRLYKLSPNQYPELTEDLVVTGCHSILVGELTEEQREKSKEFTGDVYITENRYRLIACLDPKSEPYAEEGIHTIWHLALENQDNYTNFGCYANGLLVETTSKRMMSELSGMELV